MIALSFGLSARMRSTTDFITSEHENCFLRIPVAISTALVCHNGPVTSGLVIDIHRCLPNLLDILRHLLDVRTQLVGPFLAKFFFCSRSEDPRYFG